MKKAILYEKLEKKKVNPVKSRKAGALPKAEQFNRVKCHVCSHECLIASGKRGVCGVRENKNGVLYSLSYGKVIALNIDPIEKKPFFHFLPGSRSLSLATAGCNFRCDNCQNWEISQGPKIGAEITGEKIAPEKIVEIAKEKKLPSISYTYTEPTIFIEYALDIMKLAKKQGIKNAWVSNGYFTALALEKIAPYLDAINIDLKFFKESQYQKYCGGWLLPVLNSLRLIKEKNIWLEITTLVIPGLNDSKTQLQKMADFIKQKLGAETPWHLSSFSAAISWKMQDAEDTPAETLLRAHKIGKRAGLKYVYTGNIPGMEQENTFCPKCGEKIIERIGYQIKLLYNKKTNACLNCAEKIDLILG